MIPKYLLFLGLLSVAHCDSSNMSKASMDDQSISLAQMDEKINRMNKLVSDYLHDTVSMIKQVGEKQVDIYVGMYIEPRLNALLQNNMNIIIPKLMDMYMQENFFSFLKREESVGKLMNRHKQDIIGAFSKEITAVYNDALVNISSDPLYSLTVQQNIKHHQKLFGDLMTATKKEHHVMLESFKSIMDDQINKSKIDVMTKEIEKINANKAEELQTIIDKKFADYEAKINGKVKEMSDANTGLFQMGIAFTTSYIIVRTFFDDMRKSKR